MTDLNNTGFGLKYEYQSETYRPQRGQVDTEQNTLKPCSNSENENGHKN